MNCCARCQPSFFTTFLCVVLLLWGTQTSFGQRKSRATKPTPKPAAVEEAPAPFRAGEKLDYRLLWSKYNVNAATLQLAVPERRTFFGRAAWHFQAVAHTIDTMRLFFLLDDQFDSYTEPANLVSLQYEMYLHEQGKQESHILRMSAEGDPAPGTGTAVRVLPGTRDAVAFLYFLRSIDWMRIHEAHGPVFDGRKLYEVKARLAQESGDVTVPAGHYAASRIELHVYERGQELAETRFWVWLARDAQRTPVLIEVELPLGTARVELIHAQ